MSQSDNPPAAALILALAKDEARPAAGAVGAVVVALAAELLATAADRSRSEWPEAAGTRAQALALRRRALALAEANVEAYAGARAALAARGGGDDYVLGRAIALSADPPLAIAASAADVAALGAVVADRGAADVRADAAVAALLAAAAARAAAHLVEVNLVVGADEERVARVRADAAAAADAAGRAEA